MTTPLNIPRHCFKNSRKWLYPGHADNVICNDARKNDNEISLSTDVNDFCVNDNDNLLSIVRIIRWCGRS